MVRGRFYNRKIFNKACCPECKQWYAANTMVVLNYGKSNQSLVCIGCYEDNHFTPPEPLKKGE